MNDCSETGYEDEMTRSHAAAKHQTCQYRRPRRAVIMARLSSYRDNCRCGFLESGTLRSARDPTVRMLTSDPTLRPNRALQVNAAQSS